MNKAQRARKEKIAPAGFEPASKGPKPSILDRYTTGLYVVRISLIVTYKGFGKIGFGESLVRIISPSLSRE